MTYAMQPKEVVIAGLMKATPRETLETLADMVILELRREGYVIKRGVPQCMWYSRDQD